MNSRNRGVHTRKSFGLVGLSILLILILAACQPGSIPATGATATSAPVEMPTATTMPEPTMSPTDTEAVAADEASLAVADDPEYGEILVDSAGMTLYMFTRDEPNVSNCTGDCLVNWPPLVTQGEPELGEGIDSDLVGTAELEDGSMIVTYNGMPLYYWINDMAPGDTTGQGVGDVWFVVSPEGEVIGMEAAVTESPEAAAEGEVEINVATDPEYGEILVGNDGMTLYMFTRDEPNVSNCTGDCLVNWPPLVTEGEPVLGEGVNPDLVGTAELEDGSMIVTYNGMPLYYWVNDVEPGDTTGQGVGDVWFLVSPAGEVIGMDGAMTTTTETPQAAAEGEAEISVASDPELGDILVGNDGMTLYMFTRDEPNVSNCTGDCLVSWPPLVTMGSPVLGEGVNPDMVGTAALPDGSMIVTYNGMPLYYWINDQAPGDTTGQGVGSVWYVVSPEGEIIGQ